MKLSAVGNGRAAVPGMIRILSGIWDQDCDSFTGLQFCQLLCPG